MLKIIADDLGLHKSVNDGIIFLLKEKRIAGASLMANGEAFNDAVSQCSAASLTNIGVHLVLVDEESLSGIKLPRNHRIFFIKYILGMIRPSDIEREFRAQLNKVRDAGIRPEFINSHQHLHLLPGIMEIVIRLAGEYNIPYLRIVNEPISFKNGKIFRQIQLIFLNFLSGLARRKIEKAGLRYNEYFVGFINAGDLAGEDIEQAQELSARYPDKIIELGSHPGFENDELRNKYKHWGGYNWQKELEILRVQSK